VPSRASSSSERLSRFESPGRVLGSSHTEDRNQSGNPNRKPARLPPIRHLRIPRALLSNTARFPGCLGKHDGLWWRVRRYDRSSLCVPMHSLRTVCSATIGCVLRGTAVRWRPRANWEESCGTRPTPVGGAQKFQRARYPLFRSPKARSLLSHCLMPCPAARSIARAHPGR